MPHFPYRAKGPLTGTQQTMLLWFIGIQDNYDNLKIIERGTWAKLADTY